MILVDINASNIDACRARFADAPRKVEFIVNNGAELSGVQSQSLTALFSYDAMVHFEFDDVLAYIKEIYRALEPGGRALLHHSNNDKQPGNIYNDNTHWRNFMSAALLKHAAARAGFIVLDQIVIPWAGAADIDCLSLLEKPAD